jgi:hypothetical protein
MQHDDVFAIKIGLGRRPEQLEQSDVLVFYHNWNKRLKNLFRYLGPIITKA